MRYADEYLYSMDIDWFCIIGGVLCHVASAGGMLPELVNDRDKLRTIQKRVFEMSIVFDEDDIIVNKNFLDERFGDNGESKREYLASFLNMAKRGFVSMDRTEVIDPNSQIYHIVCYPRHQFVVSNIDGIQEVEGNILVDGLMNNIHLLDFFNRT